MLQDITPLGGQATGEERPATDAWWENRVEEIRRDTRKYEMAVKSGVGGSLLKDLRVLQSSQRSESNSGLKAANGQDKLVRTED